jgi:hypothetical protein
MCASLLNRVDRLPLVVFAGLTVAAAICAGGCAGSPSNQRPAAAPPPPAYHPPLAQTSYPARHQSSNAASPATQPADADIEPSVAIQHQTEAYTQLMQPLLEQRAKANQSAVQWQGPATPPPGQPAPAPPSDRSGAIASIDDGPQSLPIMQAPRLAPQTGVNPDGLRSGRMDSVHDHDRIVAMEQMSTPQSQSPTAFTGQNSSNRAQTKAADSDELGTRLAARVHDDPHDVINQLELQLHQMLLGEPVPKLDTLSSLPTEDREVVAALLDGLVNFRNGVRQDANQPLSQKVRPLLEMASRVRAQGDLAIPTIALCSSVKTFGVYDPIEPKFTVGGEHAVILYCEVENFTTTPDTSHMYHTRLSQEVVLYTEQGQQVWSDKTATVDDASRRQRQDFFLAWLIHLPPSLGIGQYILKVTVTDQQSNRVTETTMPISVVAQ